ncbi:MAG TPA: type III-A CRISPR-associated RAMP protein Csm5 [Saprospiraceae bacterium]|nr:type III-A CRISPR-associated RAMP protein Csm5 [Saprospiraceae bacterium]HMQ81520.1 type III-A CRISPR-associated RAMP protein Csm5 [Saprospiraceae bacterium]
MELRIKTLTPLHIGNGEKLSPLEYVIDGTTYYRLDQAAFTRFLKDLSPTALRAFSDWVGEKYRAIADFEISFSKLSRDQQRDGKKDHNQQFVALSQSATPLAFCESINKRAELIRFLRENKSLTRARIDARDFKSSQVNELQKNGLQKPYLPGSSIKGSIRTALLYNWLCHHADRKSVMEAIDEQLRKKAKDTAMDDRLEAQAFYCEARINGKVWHDEAQYDLLKLLTVSDAHLAKDAFELTLADVKAYVRKREKRGNKTEFIADEQRQTPYVEAIPAQTELLGSLHFNIGFLYSIHEHLPADGKGIAIGGDYHWKYLKNKVKAVYNLDMDVFQGLNQLPTAERAKRLDELEQQVLQHIMSCLKAFNQRQLDSDRQWLDEFAKVDFKGHFADRMEEGWAALWPRRELPLLHLGFGAGFRSTTALLYFLEDQGLQKKYEDIMQTFALGLPPNKKNDKKTRADYVPKADKFPKSRRLVRTEQAISPMGWLLIGEDIAPQQASSASTSQAAQKATPAAPEFHTGAINFKKPPILDAVVTKSGSPNQVKVYYRPDDMPVLPLNGYRSALELNTVVQVQTVLNKKGQVVQVSFDRLK